jgi:hypothetical protein
MRKGTETYSSFYSLTNDMISWRDNATRGSGSDVNHTEKCRVVSALAEVSAVQYQML